MIPSKAQSASNGRPERPVQQQKHRNDDDHKNGTEQDGKETHLLLVQRWTPLSPHAHKVLIANYFSNQQNRPNELEQPMRQQWRQGQRRQVIGQFHAPNFKNNQGHGTDDQPGCNIQRLYHPWNI